MKINQISPQKNRYLKVLEDIALMPEILYYYGEWPKERERTVAIVGARKCTKYGEEVAYRLAYELGKKKIMVISGLAYGIDSIAARGVLDGGGKTIAILGTEIEKIYPAKHVKLAEEIVKRGGAVASEYKQGDEIHPKTSFLQRNRIISGLADAVVIVEAAEKSGSLNTASHAIAQGKDVFAVPGSLNMAMSAGCNRLIQKGANVYLGVEDFLNYLLPKKTGKAAQQISLFEGTDKEKEILKLLLEGIRDGDEIIEKTKISVQEYNQIITLLELKGMVRSLGANSWMLA